MKYSADKYDMLNYACLLEIKKFHEIIKKQYVINVCKSSFILFYKLTTLSWNFVWVQDIEVKCHKMFFFVNSAVTIYPLKESTFSFTFLKNCKKILFIINIQNVNCTEQINIKF